MPDIVYQYKNNLYINITNQCPNDCEFCDIEKIGFDLGVNLILRDEPSFQEITSALDNNISDVINEIVFCGGGEPLMRLNMILQITQYIKNTYPQSVRLDTCGYPYIFYKKIDVPKELKTSGLDSVSISVNSTNEEDYNKICNPDISKAYHKTLEFVKKCKNAGIQTRITFVDYKINRKQCKKLANKLNVDYYIRPYSPI